MTSERRKEIVKKYKQSPKGKLVERRAGQKWYQKNRTQIIERACRSNQKRLYGVNVPDNAVCSICSGNRGLRKIGMDHDHKTGANREPLCGPCNSALGLFADDLELLKKAVAYLEKHNA